MVMVIKTEPCVCLGELWEWLKGRVRNEPSPLPEKDASRGTERRETGKYESGEARGRKINLEKAVSALIARVWEPYAGEGENTAASGAGSLSPGESWRKVNKITQTTDSVVPPLTAWSHRKARQGGSLFGLFCEQGARG